MSGRAVAFTGLSAGTFAALWVAGAATLVALHLLSRRRARRLVVPFAPLWVQGPAEQRISRLRFSARLHGLLSLVLKLAVFSLALLAAADPRLAPAAGSGGRHVVILIDRSASMDARDEPGGRLPRARAVTRDVLSHLAPDDRALLVSYATTAIAHTPFTTDHARLEQALDDVTVAQEPDDLAAALAFGAALLTDANRRMLVVVSDHAPEDAGVWDPRSGVDLRFFAVGRRRENIGLIAMSARRAPADLAMAEVSLAIQSFASRRASRIVEVRAVTTGVVLARRDLAIEPDARLPLALTVAAPADGKLVAELIAGDARASDGARAHAPTRDDLASDDRAYAVVPVRPSMSVLVIGPPNLYLDGALLSLGPAVTVTRARRVSAPDLAADIARHDVAIVLGEPPLGVPERGRFLFVDPHGANSPWPVRGNIRDPLVTNTNTEHPVTRHVSLTDVNMTFARRLNLTRDDVVLVSARGLPLVVARERDDMRAVALAFDVRASDLPLRAAFPLLVGNAIEWLAASGETHRRSFATGPSTRVELTGAAASLAARPLVAGLTSPDGRRVMVPVADGMLPLVPEQPGFYAVDTPAPQSPSASQASDASAERHGAVVFAANLASAVESDTRAAADHPRVRLATPNELGERRNRPRVFSWSWLALAALVVALLEWVLYKRQLTT